MQFSFPPPRTVSIPVVGTDREFPVNRIFCVGRNYESHAKEMGFTGREPPFFFMKPASTIVAAASKDEEVVIDYPTLTANLHHEVELVVAIGDTDAGGSPGDPKWQIFGYAVGLDMTRRDLQNEMKKQGRPWEIGKAFAQSAPIGNILKAEEAGDVETGDISLEVNGDLRQKSSISKLIWSVAETLAQLAEGWALEPGDLIFTGTPEGVGAVKVGDVMRASVSGLPELQVRIV
jgi:fumarylpyruvate hydrolase